MEQEDYIKIANTINKCYAPTKEAQQTKMNIINHLADYFEYEDHCSCGHPFTYHMTKEEITCEGCLCVKFRGIFNREQFLKDCGVLQ